MIKQKKIIKNLIMGNTMVTDEIRYGTVACVAAIIQLSISVIYFLINCNIVAIYYVVNAPLSYILMELLIRKRKYKLCFGVIYIQILLSTLFSCSIIGWTSGFSLYNLAIVPVSYYYAYMTSNFKHKVRTANIFTCLNVCLTIGVRIHVYTYGYYYHYDNNTSLLISLYNMLISFAILGFFSILYVVEIRNSRRELERKNTELNMLASYDNLTQLLNRYSMDTIMNNTWVEALSEKKTFTLVLGDIDDFKNVNDTYGHTCGDMVLSGVAHLFKDTLSPGDAICRWGGEEFLLMIKKPYKVAQQQIENVRKKIEGSSFHYKEDVIHITMTFGMIEFDQTFGINDMIQMADKMMYQGKNHGKNQVVTYCNKDKKG